MSELITRDYNGFAIEFELVRDQLMANATAMCGAFGKKPIEWLRLPTTQRYINALKARWENPTGDNQLVVTKRDINAGTWIHERLIIKLAQWLDVEFELQCDEWVAELLRTGRVELTPEELLVQQAQALLDQSRRLKAVETEQAALRSVVDEVVARQTTIDTGYYSVAGYASLYRLPLPAQQARAFGQQAARLSREQEVPVDSVYDAKFGRVNTYHTTILAQVFPLAGDLARAA